jgi:hypothetical protein
MKRFVSLFTFKQLAATKKETRNTVPPKIIVSSQPQD